MISAPKRPRADRDSSRTAPDDVSVTGSRRAPTGPSPSSERSVPLETFEQEPRRGSDDARLQQDVPDEAAPRPE